MRVIPEIKELDILLLRKNIKEHKKNFASCLSLRQTIIIGYLLEHDNTLVCQKDLVEFLDIRRSTLAGILRTMEKRNIIVRKNVDADGRVKQLMLTDDAKKDYLSIYTILEKVENELVHGISEEDLHTFFRVIDKMKENVK